MKLRLSTFLNEDGLARKNILNILEPKLTQSNTLRSKHIVHTTINGSRGAGAKDQGADAERVPESKNTKPSNHARDSPCTFTSLVSLGQGAENVVGVDTGLASLVEVAGEDIEHQLAVRIGVDVTVGLLVEIGAQSRSIDQVAVVCEADTIWRVHVERLAGNISQYNRCSTISAFNSRLGALKPEVLAYRTWDDGVLNIPNWFQQ